VQVLRVSLWRVVYIGALVAGGLVALARAADPLTRWWL
jgi:hypothetical protein